jgi:hypothetical protein
MSPPHLRTETDPVSETLRSLISIIPDDGQPPLPKNRNFEWYTPTSEPFMIENKVVKQRLMCKPLPTCTTEDIFNLYMNGEKKIGTILLLFAQMAQIINFFL